MKKTASVDEYIEQTPAEVQPRLRQLRAAILEAVPDATEKISYLMPFYEFHGKLVYFNLAKCHISLFIPTPIVDEHREDLAGYHAVQATIHLPLNQELPIALIQKLVKARAATNLEAAEPRSDGMMAN